MALLSSWTKPGSEPAGVIVMRLAEYENVKSLTAFAPIVLLNLPMTTRPGWFHASATGPRLLSPQKPMLFGPMFHESLVKRSIAVRVLVRLISPRTFSSRQFVGTPKEWVKLLSAQGSGLGGCLYALRMIIA